MDTDGKFNRTLTSLDDRLAAIRAELIQNRTTRRSPKDSRFFSPSVVCDSPNPTPQPTNRSNAVPVPSPSTGRVREGYDASPRRHFPAVGSPEYTAAFTTPYIEPGEAERREQSDLVRVDPELARLCIALDLAPQFRLWLALRNETGWTSLDNVKLPVEITPRHLRRILASGEGIFWRRDPAAHRLYLVGIQPLSAVLVAQATPHLIETNLPGMLKDVLLPLHGSLEQFEAFLYSGWLAAKNDPKIARATLCKLFNRDKKTLRRWEKRLGEKKLQRIEAYAQIADPQTQYVPEHSFAYVAAVRDEPGAPIELKVRVAWQLPNTYRTSGIRQHTKRGQGRKVLAKSKISAGLQPLDAKAEGNRRNRYYFENGKRLRSVSRKYGEAIDHRRYLWLGVNRRGYQIYEPSENGYAETHYNERLRPIEEGQHLVRLRYKMGKERR